jgi:hypothetical protein
MRRQAFRQFRYPTSPEAVAGGTGPDRDAGARRALARAYG